MDLKTKIITLTLTAVALPVALFTGVTFFLERSVDKNIETELSLLTQQSIASISKDVHTMCNIVNDFLNEEIRRGIETAMLLSDKAGSIVEVPTSTSWTAINQDTKDALTVELPQVQLGKGALTPKTAKSELITFVDQVKKLSGLECTVFQQMNERGDMLRVATSVIDGNGKRSGEGTYLSAITQEGTPRPEVAAVLRGETFIGGAFVQGHNYFAGYYPLRDSNQKVFGMVGVGLRPSQIETLRKSILSTKVGKDGYVYVLRGKSARRGEYIISKGAERDGENIWNVTDAEGRAVIQDIINKAISADGQSISLIQYPWKNPGENEARMKLAAVTYFAPWDWVISAGAYEDEAHALKRKVASSLGKLIEGSLVLGSIILVIALFASLYLGRKISRPLSALLEISGKIASGNLLAAKDSLKNSALLFGKQSTAANKETRHLDEMGGLFKGFLLMLESLYTLIGQTQRSSLQVSSSSMEIAASARQLESAVSEQTSSTHEVAATSKEIAATSEELAKTMGGVSEELSSTISMADSGQESLSNMETAMRHLVNATGSISAKLTTISDKAHKISSVITTINKISDQTNLLSLNAAIEAEKAGEYGQGFSVVAREIRRLADQTALSTRDIERTVKEMQSAVSAGVMEMDKYAEQVRMRVEGLSSAGSQFAKIIEKVQSLAPHFKTVTEGMSAQSDAAGQISDAIIQLSSAASQTMSSLHEFNTATEQLKSAAHNLTDEVSRFTV